MTNERERALDDALRSGETPSDPEVASLAGGADVVRRHLAVPAPDSIRERALFVHGIAARRPAFLPLRFVMPAAIVIGGILAVVGFGRTALPGQTLYPVREALASVGLARTAEEDIDRRLTSARENLAEARSAGLGDPASAQVLVLAAIGDLERARTLTEELPRAERPALLVTIANLEERAVDMLVRIDEGPEAEDEDRGEDNSGPGSDNSGPGSDDSDDNSGPGSDDSDDNSGPGSDDSGSGSDDSGDDDSGSGSDDSDGNDNSGSGSDDSSGSGSGSDDDNSGSGGDDSGSGGGDDDSGSGSDD